MAVIAGSMVVQSDAVGGPREVLTVVAISGHVLATAAWLGGLVALAAVLIPRDHSGMNWSDWFLGSRWSRCSA